MLNCIDSCNISIWINCFYGIQRNAVSLRGGCKSNNKKNDKKEPFH